MTSWSQWVAPAGATGITREQTCEPIPYLTVRPITTASRSATVAFLPPTSAR
jgi:hypothetical protein